MINNYNQCNVYLKMIADPSLWPIRAQLEISMLNNIGSAFIYFAETNRITVMSSNLHISVCGLSLSGNNLSAAGLVNVYLLS